MQQLMIFGQSNPNVPYLYALIGNSASPIFQILFKSLLVYMHPFQVMLYRSLISVALSYLLMKRQNRSPYIESRETIKLVIVRIILSASSLSIYMYCTKYIPISTVQILWNLAPIFIFLIQAVHYNQRIPTLNIILSFMSFLGIILIIQPEAMFGVSSNQKVDHYYYYVVMMIFAALFNSLNVHFIHGLSRRIHPLVSMFYNQLGSLTINTVIVISFKSKLANYQPLGAKFCILLLIMSLFSFLTQHFIFLASSLKKPSLMMPFGYIAISIGFIADVNLYDTQFTPMATLGMFLTTGGLLSGYLTQKFKKADAEPINDTLLVKKSLSITTIDSQSKGNIEIQLIDMAKDRQFQR